MVENVNLSKEKKQRNTKARTAGKVLVHNLGLSEEQVEDIFDLISEEHPDL